MTFRSRRLLNFGATSFLVFSPTFPPCFQGVFLLVWRKNRREPWERGWMRWKQRGGGGGGGAEYEIAWSTSSSSFCQDLACSWLHWAWAWGKRKQSSPGQCSLFGEKPGPIFSVKRTEWVDWDLNMSFLITEPSTLRKLLFAIFL